jgi:hypothetical protein
LNEKHSGRIESLFVGRDFFKMNTTTPKIANNKQRKGNMKTKKWITSKSLAVLIALAMAHNASAVVIFQDDFNRADDPAVGPSWNKLTGSGTSGTAWALSSNTVVDPGTTGTYLLEYTGFTLGADFSVSLDIRTDTTVANTFRGLAFNMQDALNYYALRFYTNASSQGVWQLLDVAAGSPSVLANGTIGAGMNSTTFYTTTINVSSAGHIAYTIANAATPASFLLNSSVIDATPYTGGYSGMYSVTGGTFDNYVLSASAIPEPSTWVLLALSLTTVMVFRRHMAARNS